MTQNWFRYYIDKFGRPHTVTKPNGAELISTYDVSPPPPASGLTARA
ncbi:MAG TPA: hypothetical protein VFW04_14640 [Gemmatimonadaceae bacterium]|nr:hypothetical protein [Gemmatimonadaceae bacterium]